MPNETEPTQMSPEQVALHAECKVGAQAQNMDDFSNDPFQTAHPKFKLDDVKAALGAGQTPDEILDALDAQAEKVVNDKDISSEADLLLKANMALGRLITENMVILVTAIAGIQEMLHSLREGLKGGREVNEGRMSVVMSRLDVIEHTLQGKLDLIRRDVSEKACRAWDRRPLNTGGGGAGEASGFGGGGGEQLAPDYHDKAPGI